MDDLVLWLSILIVGLTITCLLVVSASGSSTSGFSAPEEVDGLFTILRLPRLLDTPSTILWQTQVESLKQIEAGGDKGLKAADLITSYARSVRLYPELYEGTTFSAWLRFLSKAGLVEVYGATVFITAEGERCLKYLEEAKEISFHSS